MFMGTGWQGPSRGNITSLGMTLHIYDCGWEIMLLKKKKVDALQRFNNCVGIFQEYLPSPFHEI